jgi:heat shock protein HslJ
LHKISANFFVVKGFFIIRYIPSISMKHLKKTKNLPLHPVLAGAMILIPVLIVSGCTGQVPQDSRLGGTGWMLTGYVHNGIPVQVLNWTTTTLEFGDDGRITGSAGCNHYFASYEVKGTAITVGPTGSTEMYCTSPGVMVQESAYLRLLGQVTSITVDGDRLTLGDANGTAILSFARIIPPAAAPLVGTNWTLESIYMGDAVSSVIAGTTITAVFGEDGSLAGSAGCNHYFTRYNATGTSLSVGPVGSTKMYCTAPGVMQQEMTYLALLGQTKNFTIKGGRLTLADMNGASILSYAKTVRE